MLWFAVAAWLVLAVRLVYRRDRLMSEARSPAAFADVVGTAVLGTRFALQGNRAVAAALLGLAAVWWALLVLPVLRHWQTPTVGISFLPIVGTESLGVLGASLAVSYRAGWLLTAAVAGLFAGLAIYVFAAARFDLRELVNGHGDHWVTGGALAASALAAAKITEGSRALGQLSAQHSALTTGTLVLWCLAMAWLLPLVTAEVLRPRPGYDVRRWATVFPLGMYAACSFGTGQVTGITGITDFGRWWTWVAFAASLLALGGLFRRGRLVLRSQRPRLDAGDRCRAAGTAQISRNVRTEAMETGQSQSHSGFRLNGTPMIVRAVLIGVGSLIGLAGLIVGGAEMVSAARRWLREREGPPSEEVKHKLGETKALTQPSSSPRKQHDDPHHHSRP